MVLPEPGRILLTSRKLGLLTFGLLCAGCPSPNIYGPPRTTPPGELSHSAAMEGVGFSLRDAETGAEAKFFTPSAPTYTLRVGLVERLDLGFRVANFSSIGADLKWNVVQSEVFDLAIDPSIQYYHLGGSSSSLDADPIDEWSLDVLRMNGVLLFGINASSSFTIMPTLGVAYTEAIGTFGGLTDLETGQASSGFAARFGLGLNIRASQKFAIQPEVTVLRPLETRGDEGFIYVIGVGFNFGKLPIYEQEGAPPATAPAPGPAAPPATQYPGQ